MISPITAIVCISHLARVRNTLALCCIIILPPISSHSFFLHSLVVHSFACSPPCPVTGGNQQHKALIDEVRADATKLTPAQAAAVKALWADAGIQVCAREQCRCDEM